MSVLLPLADPRRLLLAVRVLHPVPRIVNRAESKVDADVRLGANQRRIAKELVGAEAIGLDVVPRQLEPGGTLIARTDAILPVVAGAEIAARPPENRDLEIADRLQDVLAKSVLVGERAALLEDAAVDHAAEMLGEVAEQQRIDRADDAIGVELDAGDGGAGGCAMTGGQAAARPAPINAAAARRRAPCITWLIVQSIELIRGHLRPCLRKRWRQR